MIKTEKEQSFIDGQYAGFIMGAISGLIFYGYVLSPGDIKSAAKAHNAGKSVRVEGNKKVFIWNDDIERLISTEGEAE